jgi:hypothetical protein
MSLCGACNGTGVIVGKGKCAICGASETGDRPCSECAALAKERDHWRAMADNAEQKYLLAEAHIKLLSEKLAASKRH